MNDFQAAIADLQTKVQADADVEMSAIALLNGLKLMLDQAIAALPTGTDVSSLQALSSQIDSNTQSLAAAVASDTPAP